VVDSFEVEREMTLRAMPGLLLETGGKEGGEEFPWNSNTFRDDKFSDTPKNNK
jgi:hypothetical protein